MSWRIELKAKAKRTLETLDKPIQKRILDFLSLLGDMENPRYKGEALQGEHGLWKYRIGDYRIIAQIRDQQLIVLVLKIGYRSRVYKDLPKG